MLDVLTEQLIEHREALIFLKNLPDNPIHWTHWIKEFQVEKGYALFEEKYVKVYQTKSGTALYFNYALNTYYTTNYNEVRDALLEDFFSLPAYSAVSLYADKTRHLIDWATRMCSSLVPEEIRGEIIN